uniref:USP domain-containing protein n=1 Tax=Panagrolaimus sp. PS1159 TaxID=55785 RepID=A0AC35GUF1_9BILA
MARPIPPERHSSQSTSTYGFSEVDKFLKNTNNTNFMPNYNLNNGLRYDIEPRRRDIIKEQVPSPGTLYDIDQSRAYHGYNEGESPKHRSRHRSGHSNLYYEQKDNNLVDDKYPGESPVSPTSEYFSRHDKSRKSTLKQAVNSLRDIIKEQVPSPGILYDIDQSRAYHGYNEGESPKHRSRQRSGHSNLYYEQKDNNMIDDKYPDESPVSPTSEYFSRHDKSRKSTLKQAVNSLFRIFRNKNANHKDDSQLYMGSKNISNSAHVVHRSGSNRGSGSSNFQRTHSFSAPSRQDRSRSVNTREINNTVIVREDLRREPQLPPFQQHPPPRIPPKSEILEAKAKLQPLNRDTGGLPLPKPMPLPVRRQQQQQIVQQIAIQRPTPCQTGIINHGNSCYMNSILQCLACTDKFAQLFVTDNYLKYLKKSSGQKLESSKNHPPPRIPPKSEILEAKAKLQPLNRDTGGLPLPKPMPLPVRQQQLPQQQQIIQQTAIQRPTPCQTGIINHGNSCYMNSILQCLACTDKFAQLFVTDNYLKYLKKSSGQKSESSKNVSTVLATVLQNMWFNGEIDNAVWKLSQVTAENNSQFGNAYQQDAQEYLIWLLDKIHEELKDENCRNHLTSNNRTMNRSEEELAEESLTRLQDGSCSAITKLFCAQFQELAEESLTRLQDGSCSAITKLFCAQFRSSIECVSCKFRNLSFDPFRCVSLTVSPNKNLHLFSAVWIPYNLDRSLTRYGLRMRSNSTIHEMISFLSTQVRNMSEDFTIPCLLLPSGMCHLLDPRIQIPINTSCPLVLIEVPDGEVKPANTDYIATICTFAFGYGNDSKRHGFPFVVVVHRMWNYTKILEEILHRGNDLINYRIASLSTHRENCKIVVGDANEGAVLDPGLSFPLLSCNTQNQTSYNDNRMPILQLTIK